MVFGREVAPEYESHQSKKMRHEEGKKTDASRIYLETYVTESKTKNRRLIWKGKLFNYAIAHRTTG